jgi:uncharacterized membrane protein YjgN (DUF898 family)
MSSPDPYQPASGQPYPPAAYPPQPYYAPALPVRAQTRQFAFDGGAGTYIGTALLGFVITLFTLGLCYPFALVLMERWRAKHSWIEGRQLVFTGSAWGLFGMWWKWLLLIIVTLGIYSFWVTPRLFRWKWENTSWAQQLTYR